MQAMPVVQIKEEPLSEEGEDEDKQGIEEETVGGDSLNGHPPRGCTSIPVARELWAFGKATFQSQFVLTLSELKRLFHRPVATCPVAMGSSVASRTTCRRPRCWPLAVSRYWCRFPRQTAASPNEQKVFALWESGDRSEQHGQVLFEIFSKNYRVHRNMIPSHLTQECGEDLIKQEVIKVLKDCNASYGDMWYLKGRTGLTVVANH
ncbi:DNA-directed RNA polymerase III subunit RPC5 [Fukomys damarensis]|uniref:DNA-directed RNA polymerase III subunit RPC5 n=1 Tax=Fukomys damarensis TaxID=885580 RepID=A0A091D7A0_FUKDA|nr:DNA-directed RNA polymerase III subunit RPC5 [Fukomys damarensis]